MIQPTKVKFAIQGAIARITLDRSEKLNALDPEMLAALEDAVTQAEQSRQVRVIVLAAAGEKAFCVGADILAWTALSPLDMWSEWVRRAIGFSIGSSEQSSRFFARSKALLTEGVLNWRSRATSGSSRTRPDLPCPKSNSAPSPAGAEPTACQS